MTRSRFPHALALLTGCIVLAAVLSHVLPAGRYDRRDDPVTGRKVAVAGTYHAVEQHPVGFFQMLVALPKGMLDAGSVVFLVFLAGGAVTVVDKTRALRQTVGWLVRKLQRRERWAIPVMSVLFGTLGALDNTQEEIIALVPVLLIFSRRIGLSALTIVAASVGSAIVGASFSPINPFQVGIAQKLAALPLLSGAGFRVFFLVLAMALWTWGTMRMSARTRTEPVADAAAEDQVLDTRRAIVLAAVAVAVVTYIIGVMRWDWGFDEMSALFFAMGVVAGLIGGLGVDGTADAFVEGFASMAYAAMMIGFARAIYVVLDQGQIVDTIVHACVAPLDHLPLAASGLGMIVFHALVHFPVPSVSGQAVLTMPVLIPISDLIGLSRQVTVFAYQVGAGMSDLLSPTNGAMMAVIAAAKVRYDDWLKFVTPLFLGLLALGGVGVIVGIAGGLR
jgi:uncharacterized ion transporter superfamily protein YfcC